MKKLLCSFLLLTGVSFSQSYSTFKLHYTEFSEENFSKEKAEELKTGVYSMILNEKIPTYSAQIMGDFRTTTYFLNGGTEFPSEFKERTIDLSVKDLENNHVEGVIFGLNPLLFEEECDLIPYTDQFGNDSIRVMPDGTKEKVYVPCPASVLEAKNIAGIASVNKMTYDYTTRQLSSETMGLIVYFYYSKGKEIVKKGGPYAKVFIDTKQNFKDKGTSNIVLKNEVLTTLELKKSQVRQPIYYQYKDWEELEFAHYLIWDYLNPNGYMLWNSEPTALFEKILFKDLFYGMEKGELKNSIPNFKKETFLNDNLCRLSDIPYADQYGYDSTQLYINPKTLDSLNVPVYMPLPSVKPEEIKKYNLGEKWIYNFEKGYFRKEYSSVEPKLEEFELKSFTIEFPKKD